MEASIKYTRMRGHTHELDNETNWRPMGASRSYGLHRIDVLELGWRACGGRAVECKEQLRRICDAGRCVVRVNAQFTIKASDETIHTELLAVTWGDVEREFLMLESSFGTGRITVEVTRCTH